MSIYGAQSAISPRFDDTAHHYDALLVMSFGGPEGTADVMPFLERVTSGRNVPRERLAEVAVHYEHFGGVSPINSQNRDLIGALGAELARHDITLPIYFGNRNWHPLVSDTVREMRADGVRRALVFVTSAFSSYSGCRQYREDIIAALEATGADTGNLLCDKIRVFYNHPGFVEPMADRLREAAARVPADRRTTIEVIFTAHSIPLAMARGCAYEAQLRESCRLVAAAAGMPRFRLAYQSRSGSPHVPWLEPDVLDVMRALHAARQSEVIVAPIGFISDHMEVLFDLDEEAAELARGTGMTMVRAGTVGTHPAFVAMIRELIVERMTATPERRALGTRGPNHDICPVNCCSRGETRPPATVSATATAASGLGVP